MNVLFFILFAYFSLFGDTTGTPEASVMDQQPKSCWDNAPAAVFLKILPIHELMWIWFFRAEAAKPPTGFVMHLLIGQPKVKDWDGVVR